MEKQRPELSSRSVHKAGSSGLLERTFNSPAIVLPAASRCWQRCGAANGNWLQIAISARRPRSFLAGTREAVAFRIAVVNRFGLPRSVLAAGAA